MLGLSTAWMSENLHNDDDLFRTLTDVGLDFLELEYRIPESLFVKMKPKLKNKVISIHNFFPFPQEYSHCKPSGDLFLLSSLDHEEREKQSRLQSKPFKPPMTSNVQQWCSTWKGRDGVRL